MAGNALRLVISISASADSARSVAQRLRFRRSRHGQRASFRNLSLKPWTFSPIKGRSLSRRDGEPAWAGRFLDEWCRQTMRSRIEPMKKIARSLRQHRELILNYFRAQKLISGGVVKGLNNKAKVTMRKSYGFRTYRVLELALYHSFGKLPEPVSTHDFF
jgi:transposase